MRIVLPVSSGCNLYARKDKQLENGLHSIILHGTTPPVPLNIVAGSAAGAIYGMLQAAASHHLRRYSETDSGVALRGSKNTISRLFLYLT